MKVTFIEIEASNEDLRSSSTLAESFTNVLRRVFNPPMYSNLSNVNVEEEEDTDE